MSRNAWYGYRRDTLDMRDHLFRPSVTRLPASVDLRRHCPPVMNQGALGSCTAHGITGALRYELMRAGHADVPLARLQLYYDERAKEGTIGEDAGAEIRDGIKCAGKLGVAHEALWPYRPARFKDKPSPVVYRDAVQFEALAYERVAVDAVAIKQALAHGFAVVIGVSLYASFESPAVERTGMVPMPQPREKMIGGHCMYVVGYGQKPGTFTVRNSWGSWADKGDCYFAEAYLGSPQLGSDYWIIKSAGRKV